MKTRALVSDIRYNRFSDEADGTASYRLRAWLVDGNAGEIHIQSRQLSPPRPATAAQFLGQDSSVAFVPMDGISPPLRVAALRRTDAGRSK